MKIKVGAIIVTYNSELKLLRDQFYSLNEQVDVVIYVDNGSANIEHIKTIISEFSNVKERVFAVFQPKNMGLGYAQNCGINKATELNLSHVLILDHDSIPGPSFVNELTSAYERLQSEGMKVGAVGPIYLNEKTGEQYPITKYWGPFIKRIKPKIGTLVEASFLISSGSLIQLDVFEDVGMMNERLFVDYIDVEWSFRAASRGYKLIAVQNAVMNHQIGDNRVNVFGRMISVHSPTRRYYLTRNSIFMLRCPYVGWGYKVREVFFNILRVFIFVLISDQRKRYLSFSLRGLRDGMLGRYGSITEIRD